MNIKIFAFYSDKPVNILHLKDFYRLMWHMYYLRFIHTSEYCVGLTWRADSIAKGSPAGMSDFYPTGIADKLQQPELYVHV